MNSVATMRTAPPRPKALADGEEHANPDEESCLLTFVTDSRANKVRGREPPSSACCRCVGIPYHVNYLCIHERDV
jgi:hypothetical protein